MIYRIANWEETYETAETRKLESLRWVPVPNKHDGLGYRRITQQRDRADLLAAWVLLVQVASKGRRGQRGAISRDGRPLDADDLSLMTGFPAPIFERALAFFSDPKQGWLSATKPVCDPSDEASCTAQASGSPSVPAESPARPADSPATPGDSPAEGKGREGREKKGGKGPKAAASPMLLPFPSEDFRSAWELFERHRREIRKPMTPTAAAMALKHLGGIGEYRALRALEHTISKGWQGLREPDQQTPALGQQSASRPPPGEPHGWKPFLNHEFPDSVFSDGGVRQASQWSDLDADTQRWLVAQMMRKAV